jgi:hypothetical protein
MRTEQFIKKWLYSISLFIGCSLLTTTYAQKTFVETGMHGHRDLDLIRAITDTLDDHFDSATATLYASPNGGFVGGNSGYGESAKAQEFDVDAPLPYFVEGFIYWFGFKSMESLPSDSSYLNLKFWNNNYTATVGSFTRQIPYSVFDSTKLYIQNLNADTMYAGGVNVWMLPTPQYVSANYSVGFSMEHLHYKDTISLMMTTDGDPPVSYMSWEKWHYVWNIIEYAWSLDSDFGIFPLVDLGTASVESNQYINGLKYSLYPNPAADWMNVDMELQTDGEYRIFIHDLSGKLIKSQNLGYLSPGRISTSVEVFELPTGNYILSITNGSKGLSKKFIKQ